MEGNDIRLVAVHPDTDRAAVDSLELCRPCAENPSATWRIRWQPAQAAIAA